MTFEAVTNPKTSYGEAFTGSRLRKPLADGQARDNERVRWEKPRRKKSSWDRLRMDEGDNERVVPFKLVRVVEMDLRQSMFSVNSS